LLASCPWLRLHTWPDLHRLLQRVSIHRKRGRSYIHSPDPAYLEKLALIETCRQHAQAELARACYSKTSSASTVSRWWPRLTRPLTRRGGRRVAALNPLTGRVTSRQYNKFCLAHLAELYAVLCADYPQAGVVYLVVDDWPITRLNC
jgi:hypothetical protein